MIPKIIHQIWIQGEKNAPDHIKNYISSCKLNGYQHILWDEPKILKLMKKHNDPDLIRIYHKQEKKAAQADIARYVILYYYGGFYIDSDYQCLKSLEVFRNSDLIYVPGISTDISNGFIGVKIKHPLFLILFREIKNRENLVLEGHYFDKILYRTGTFLYYDAIREYHNNYPDDNNYLIIHHHQLHPCGAFEAPHNCHHEYKNIAFAIHNNEGSWSPEKFTAIKKQQKEQQMKEIRLYIIVGLFFVILFFIYKTYKYCTKCD